MHDIVPGESDISSIYDLTTEQLKKVIDLGSLAVESGIVDGITLYFDDSFVSLVDRVMPMDKPAYCNTNAAVITDTINKNGHLSEADIEYCVAQGVSISSHGVSHAAFAIYDNADEALLPTPAGGRYSNMPYGKAHVLSENQVLFQLNESKLQLEDICQNEIYEIVLPYGLYNPQTLNIIKTSTTYNFVTTCDAAVDTNQRIRPRYLVTQENIAAMALASIGLPEAVGT
jgi:hypothetical protein